MQSVTRCVILFKEISVHCSDDKLKLRNFFSHDNTSTHGYQWILNICKLDMLTVLLTPDPPSSSMEIGLGQYSSEKVTFWQTGDLDLSCNTLYLLSPRSCFFIELKRDLFVYRDESLTS